MRDKLLGCLLLALPLLVWAAPDDDWRLLQKVTDAGRQQSLSGTYLHQMNGVLETFHIVRAGGAGAVVERRVALDGLPREIVRNGENLTCYAPDKKSLVAAKISAMRLFPALASDDVVDVAQSYSLHRQGSDRVAQRDCNWIELKPHDQLRNTERICADQNSFLPLKMMTLTPQNEVIEQYTFTDVELTAPHDKAQLKPRFKLSSQLRGPGVTLAPGGGDGQVEVTGLLPGFRLIRSVQRSPLLVAGGKSVRHMVFSDGLVMLSVFVEPLPADAPTARTLNLHGAINMATTIQGDQLFTLVGDLPESTLSSLARTIHFAVRQ